MKATHATLVRRGWRTVAFKTFFVADLANLESRGWFLSRRHVVLFSLEIFPVLFVGKYRCLVGNLPIVADRQGVALIAASRRWDRLPGREHSASGSHGERDNAGNEDLIFHEFSPVGKMKTAVALSPHNERIA